MESSCFQENGTVKKKAYNIDYTNKKEIFVDYTLFGNVKNISRSGYNNIEPVNIKATYYDLVDNFKIELEFDKTGKLLNEPKPQKLTKKDIETIKYDVEELKQTINNSIPDNKNFPINNTILRKSSRLEQDNTGGYIHPSQFHKNVNDLINGHNIEIKNPAPEFCTNNNNASKYIRV